MLDERTRTMLEVANTLTAEDLDFVRGSTVTGSARPAKTPGPRTEASSPSSQLAGVPSRGERERLRTRDSKVSTACMGSARPGHQWWPVGTELAGTIGAEQFTAQVVENPRVKSGRSVLITSGSAQGRICITPTRAAIEATEAYRQSHNLGRGGGVTNGWTFWKPETTSQ